MSVQTVPVATGRATGIMLRHVGADGAPCVVDLVDAATVRFEQLPAYRVIRGHKGQRNFVGLWWFATTGQHVPYESWVERDQVMVMDRDRDVVAVRSRPFAVDVGAGTWHVPDYFARLADGRARMVDVRSGAGGKDQKVYAAARQVCASVGWEYRLAGELPAVERANLRWLAAYRHPRYRTAGIDWAGMRSAVAAAGRVRLGQVPALVGVSAVAVLPQAYHRLWTGQLRADVSRLLTMASMIEVSRP